MKNNNLIINADDFGYSHSVNRAIIQSFSEGLCSSTTIMSNMQGYKEAIELCHKEKLLDKTGIHIVLSEGTPLTDKIKKCPRICHKSGQFRTKAQILNLLQKDEKEAIYEEIVAQIDICRKNGLPLTHLDSHMHKHIEFGVFRIILKIARIKDIKFIRLSRSMDPDSLFLKNLYRKYINLWLSARGYAGTRFFGNVNDYLKIGNEDNIQKNISFEIMIHPGFENDILIDKISSMPLEDYIKQIKNYRQAVSYGYLNQKRKLGRSSIS